MAFEYQMLRPKATFAYVNILITRDADLNCVFETNEIKRKTTTRPIVDAKDNLFMCDLISHN